MKGSHPCAHKIVLAFFVFGALNASAGDGKIHHLPDKVPNSYIVRLYDERSTDSVGRELEKWHGGKLVAVAGELGMFSIKLPNEAAAEAIARDPRVAAIQEDGILYAQGCQRPLDPTGTQWGLGHIQGIGSSLFTNPNDTIFSDNPGLSLNIVQVYIIDGDINPFNAYPVSDLTDPVYGSSKVKESHNFVPATGGGGDENGPHAVSPIYSHGTAVASILAGNTYGVVPEISSITSLVVLDGLNRGSDTAFMQAADFVVTTHQNGVPAVANVSIGAQFGDLELDHMVQRIADDGVFVAAAAGNWHQDTCISSPARVTGPSRSGMLLVGATDYDGYQTDYSNYGPCVDIWAPGGTNSRPVTTSAGSGTGTSLAAPEVAGAAVLVYASHPTWTPPDVASQIKYIWWNYNRGLRTLQIPFSGCYACTCDPPPGTY